MKHKEICSLALMFSLIGFGTACQESTEKTKTSASQPNANDRNEESRNAMRNSPGAPSPRAKP